MRNCPLSKLGSWMPTMYFFASSPRILSAQKGHNDLSVNAKTSFHTAKNVWSIESMIVLPCLGTIESNLECHDSKHQVFIQSKSFPLGIFRCLTPNRWKQVDKCVRFREQLCASALQSGWWFHFVHSFMIPAFHISVGYAWIWHNHHSPSYIHIVSHILIILHVRRITHIYPKGN